MKTHWICKVETRHGNYHGTYFLRIMTDVDDRMEADKKRLPTSTQRGRHGQSFGIGRLTR